MINHDKLLNDVFSNKKNINIYLKRVSRYPNITKYLETRFDYVEKLLESIYRLINNIEERPVCQICGSKVRFNNSRGFRKYCCKECQKIGVSKSIKQTCIERYGTISTFQLEIVKEKSRNTKIERYNDCNYRNKEKMKQTKLERYGSSSYVNSQKAKETMLERYGTKSYFGTDDFKRLSYAKYDCEWPSQSKEVKDKIINTCIDRYDCCNTWQSESTKESIRNTKLERYGDASYNNSEKISNSLIQTYKNHKEEIVSKAKNTLIAHYGKDHYFKTIEGKQKLSTIVSSKEFQDKSNNTKRKNNTFNSSNLEEQSYNILKDIYGETDIIRQYKSEEYPYKCDFYIKSLDLYIECNYHWTHGGHAYDKNNKEDVIKANKYKASSSKFYNNAYKTWTILDVNKLETFIKNKLNYFVFYSFDDFKTHFYYNCENIN